MNIKELSLYLASMTIGKNEETLNNISNNIEKLIHDAIENEGEEFHKEWGVEFHTLTHLRDEALRIAVEHGFKDASIPEDFALMHSEISEALEDYRAGKVVNELTYNTMGEMYPNVLKPEGIPSEMADVIIRVLHFCGKHQIDIEKAVIEKMKYNESRPYKHGKKL